MSEVESPLHSSVNCKWYYHDRGHIDRFTFDFMIRDYGDFDLSHAGFLHEFGHAIEVINKIHDDSYPANDIISEGLADAAAYTIARNDGPILGLYEFLRSQTQLKWKKMVYDKRQSDIVNRKYMDQFEEMFKIKYSVRSKKWTELPKF